MNTTKEKKPIVGRIYKHYEEGNLYNVLAIAIHKGAEVPKNELHKESLLVIYQSLKDKKIYARSLYMWNMNVFYDGKVRKRFVLQPLQTLEELEDEYFGKKGSSKRNKYTKLVRKSIKKNSKKKK
jgi:hypothetical protein